LVYQVVLDPGSLTAVKDQINAAFSNLSLNLDGGSGGGGAFSGLKARIQDLNNSLKLGLVDAKAYGAQMAELQARALELYRSEDLTAKQAAALSGAMVAAAKGLEQTSQVANPLEQTISELRNQIGGLLGQLRAGNTEGLAAQLAALRDKALLLSKTVPQTGQEFRQLSGAAASAQGGLDRLDRAFAQQVAAQQKAQEELRRLRAEYAETGRAEQAAAEGAALAAAKYANALRDNSIAAAIAAAKAQVASIRDTFVAAGGDSQALAAQLRRLAAEFLENSRQEGLSATQMRGWTLAAAQAERAAAALTGEVARLGLASQVRLGLQELGNASMLLGGNFGLASSNAAMLVGGMGRLAASLSPLALGFVTAGASVLGVGLAAGQAVAAFAPLEKQQAFLEAITGRQAGAYAALTERLVGLSTQLPVTATALYEVATEAANLGVTGVENLAAFTKVVQELAIVTRGNAAQIATDLARFLGETGVTSESKNYLATLRDVSNALAAVHLYTAATASETLTLARYMAAGSTAMHVTQGEIIAVAGSLNALGSQAQAGGSAFVRILTDLQMGAVHSSTAFENMARLAGVGTEEFKRLTLNAPVQAFLALTDGIHKAVAAGVPFGQVMDALHVKNVRDIRELAQLSEGHAIFTQTLKAVMKAQEQKKLLDDLVAQSTGNLKDQTALFENRLHALFIVIGSQITPGLTAMLGGVNKNTDGWVSFGGALLQVSYFLRGVWDLVVMLVQPFRLFADILLDLVALIGQFLGRVSTAAGAIRPFIEGLSAFNLLDFRTAGLKMSEAWAAVAESLKGFGGDILTTLNTTIATTTDAMTRYGDAAQRSFAAAWDPDKARAIVARYFEGVKNALDAAGQKVTPPAPADLGLPTPDSGRGLYDKGKPLADLQNRIRGLIDDYRRLVESGHVTDAQAAAYAKRLRELETAVAHLRGGADATTKSLLAQAEALRGAVTEANRLTDLYDRAKKLDFAELFKLDLSLEAKGDKAGRERIRPLVEKLTEAQNTVLTRWGEALAQISEGMEGASSKSLEKSIRRLQEMYLEVVGEVAAGKVLESVGAAMKETIRRLADQARRELEIVKLQEQARKDTEDQRFADQTLADDLRAQQTEYENQARALVRSLSDLYDLSTAEGRRAALEQLELFTNVLLGVGQAGTKGLDVLSAEYNRLTEENRKAAEKIAADNQKLAETVQGTLADLADSLDGGTRRELETLQVKLAGLAAEVTKAAGGMAAGVVQTLLDALDAGIAKIQNRLDELKLDDAAKAREEAAKRLVASLEDLYDLDTEAGRKAAIAQLSAWMDTYAAMGREGFAALDVFEKKLESLGRVKANPLKEVEEIIARLRDGAAEGAAERLAELARGLPTAELQRFAAELEAIPGAGAAYAAVVGEITRRNATAALSAEELRERYGDLRGELASGEAENSTTFFKDLDEQMAALDRRFKDGAIHLGDYLEGLQALYDALAEFYRATPDDQLLKLGIDPQKLLEFVDLLRRKIAKEGQGTAAANPTPAADQPSPSRWWEGFLRALEDGLAQVFGALLQGIPSLLSGVTSDAERILEKALAGSGEIASGISKAISGALSGNLGEAVSGLLQILKPFLDELQPVLRPLLQIFAQLMNAARPLAQGLAALLSALEPLFQAIVTGLTPVFRAIGDILKALAPILRAFMEAIAPLVAFFSEVVGAILEALAPLIRIVGAVLTPIFRLLGAVLQPVIEVIKALFNAISAILRVITFGLVNLGQVGAGASLDNAPVGTTPETAAGGGGGSVVYSATANVSFNITNASFKDPAFQNEAASWTTALVLQLLKSLGLITAVPSTVAV
jgi:TP901 family phage tail tape measure protein